MNRNGSGVRIALIDYGAGNLASVRKGLTAAGAEVMVVDTAGKLEASDAIVLPGVGHFRAGALLDVEWRQAIARLVHAGMPLLGICLGMQLLFEGSDEAPDVPGLGLLRGRCGRIKAERPLKVPHVGWNELASVRPNALFEGIAGRPQVYFTHAYAGPVTEDCTAVAVHGHAFAAAVQRVNVCGVQFHPEQSGSIGLQILRNLVRMAGS